jgi:hypothetical protein
MILEISKIDEMDNFYDGNGPERHFLDGRERRYLLRAKGTPYRLLWQGLLSCELQAIPAADVKQLHSIIQYAISQIMYGEPVHTLHCK